MFRNLQITLALMLMGTLAIVAATPAIGTVQASGEFRLNQASGYANSTLFDGALLETKAVRSDITFTSGGHMAVGPNSKTHVYKTYAVLDSGAADVNAVGYKLKAANLSISGSGAQVLFNSASKVQVGAVSSPVEVRNSSDMLIARVFPGQPLEFDTAGGQGGASGPVTVSGKVEKKEGLYMVTDCTTNVTYQVQGSDIDKRVGKNAKVQGSIVPGSGAVQVIAASSVTAAKGSGCPIPAAMAGAAGAGMAGLSHAAIAGIVIGGAVAASLGIAAGVGAFDSASGK